MQNHQTVLNQVPPESEASNGSDCYLQRFRVQEYDLDSTLSSGQAFRWQRYGRSWQGVIGPHWVRLTSNRGAMIAETVDTVSEWSWLRIYLQLELPLSDVLKTFPQDTSIQAAVTACRGLRLLRQDPWECLASFILSSNKQIVQIQQIVDLLCRRYGEPIAVPPGHPAAHTFPCPARLAGLTEADLRACKMGFRAPYLLETARSVASGQFDLQRLHSLRAERARDELMYLPGVGRKIADCVLLFAYGFQAAFPVDVWVMKALHQLYFPGRAVKPQRLYRFTSEYFGPNAGYAQQYLFHYMRTVQAAKAKVQDLVAKSRNRRARVVD